MTQPSTQPTPTAPPAPRHGLSIRRLALGTLIALGSIVIVLMVALTLHRRLASNEPLVKGAVHKVQADIRAHREPLDLLLPQLNEAAGMTPAQLAAGNTLDRHLALYGRASSLYRELRDTMERAPDNIVRDLRDQGVNQGDAQAVADRMRLELTRTRPVYDAQQHSVDATVAILTFLKANTGHWRIAPDQLFEFDTADLVQEYGKLARRQKDAADQYLQLSAPSPATRPHDSGRGGGGGAGDDGGHQSGHARSAVAAISRSCPRVAPLAA